MKMIYICSPWRARTEEEKAANIEIVKDLCRKVIMAGNIPIAPHLYFTQFLNDDHPQERNTGMAAGLKLLESCSEVVAADVPPTKGMKVELIEAVGLGLKVTTYPADPPEDEKAVCCDYCGAVLYSEGDLKPEYFARR
jgi:hypothetical protein